MIYDISPRITSTIRVWPGDTPREREVLLDIAKGDNLTLSTLRSTVHLGAHADAPSHYAAHAPSIADRSLEHYLGPCQVIAVDVGRGETIKPAHFRACSQERVLFKTGTFPDPERWNEDFAALSPELVVFLAGKGVRTVGIDTPSVDPFHSKDLPAHGKLLQYDMANLEGLVLTAVPEGVYELIALPLPLEGFDASPVRAILRTVPIC